MGTAEAKPSNNGYELAQKCLPRLPAGYPDLTAGAIRMSNDPHEGVQ